MKQLGSTEQKRLNREWRRRTGQRVALLLDRVQQPFNVGSIIRTAAALRIEQIWAVADTPDPRVSKVAKVALGTDRYLQWHQLRAPRDAADAARAEGFRIVGLELAEGATALHEADLSGQVCLAVGHEDRGLSPAALDACDQVVYIPQLGRVGSLNVAQAAAIAMFETRRQGWTALLAGLPLETDGEPPPLAGRGPVDLADGPGSS